MLPAKGNHFKNQTILCPAPQSRLVLATCGLETSTLIARDLSPPTLLQHTMREQCVVEPQATIETNPYSGNKATGAQRTTQSVVISQTKPVGSYKDSLSFCLLEVTPLSTVLLSLWLYPPGGSSWVITLCH